MSPYEELAMWRNDFQRFRRKIYILTTVSFTLILAGLTMIGGVYFTGQDEIRGTSCQNSQTLVTQYEWFKALTIQNATHLSKPDIAERVKFYNAAESLIPTTSCHMSLEEMQHVAQTQISLLHVHL